MYPDEDLEPEKLSTGEDDEFSGESQARFDFDLSSNFNLGEAQTEEALR